MTATTDTLNRIISAIVSIVNFEVVQPFQKYIVPTLLYLHSSRQKSYLFWSRALNT